MSRRVHFGDDGLPFVEFALTQTRSSARLKRRSGIRENGIDISPRQTNLCQNDYVEWQIGYDIPTHAKDQDGEIVSNASQTLINDRSFTGADGGAKFAFELSEIVFGAYNAGMLSSDKIRETFELISSVADEDVLDRKNSVVPYRQGGCEREYNGMRFLEVDYVRPILIRTFGRYEVHTELTKDRRQIGSGLQMMLYLCIPIAALEADPLLIGRKARQKEKAIWRIGIEEIDMFLETIKMFGMMSLSHKNDVISLFRMLFGDVLERDC